MARYQIYSRIYTGCNVGEHFDGAYRDDIDPMTHYETDNYFDARLAFDALTTLSGIGMDAKTFGTYMHYKWHEVDGIFADFILYDWTKQDALDIRYECLWLN